MCTCSCVCSKELRGLGRIRSLLRVLPAFSVSQGRQRGLLQVTGLTAGDTGLTVAWRGFLWGGRSRLCRRGRKLVAVGLAHRELVAAKLRRGWLLGDREEEEEALSVPQKSFPRLMVGRASLKKCPYD